MYYVMRASAPSLHRESTDSLIYMYLYAPCIHCVPHHPNLVSFLFIPSLYSLFLIRRIFHLLVIIKLNHCIYDLGN